MEEGREGPPQGKSWRQRLVSVAKKAAGTSREIAATLDTRPEKVPLEEINKQTVARAILDTGSFFHKEREEWTSPLTAAQIMPQLGYVANEDYHQDFPAEYSKFIQATWQLEKAKVLEIEQLENAPHHEAFCVWVISESKLRKLAEKKEPVTK